MPLRVLLLTHAYPTRDDRIAGAFVARLAQALTADGVDVRVFSAHGRDPGGGATTDDGIPVLRIGATGPWRPLTTPLAVLRHAWAMWGALQRLGGHRAGRPWPAWRPDVIHAQWFAPAGLAVAGYRARQLAGWETPPALVVTAHGSDLRHAQRSRLGRTVVRWLAMALDATAAVSPSLATTLHTSGRPRRPVAVLPMPVARAATSSERDAAARLPTLPVDATRPFLLFVGRLVPEKGLHVILEAMALLSASMPLVVIGDGPARDALVARAHHEDVADRVHWMGAVDPSELPALLAASAAHGLLVVPSQIPEGLGLVAVEGQAAGLAVIVSDVAGLRDVVDDTGATPTGWRVRPADDREAWVATLRAVLEDPVARDQRRVNALVTVDRFTAAAVSAAHRAWYAEVVRSPRHADPGAHAFPCGMPAPHDP